MEGDRQICAVSHVSHLTTNMERGREGGKCLQQNEEVVCGLIEEHREGRLWKDKYQKINLETISFVFKIRSFFYFGCTLFLKHVSQHIF